MSEVAVLRRRSDIQHLFKQGRSAATSDVVLVYLRTETGTTRLVVVASRKVGNAVRRNRAKRLLREAHRQMRREYALAGADLALVARAGAPAEHGREIRRQIEYLYRQAGLLIEDGSGLSPAEQPSSGESSDS